MTNLQSLKVTFTKLEDGMQYGDREDLSTCITQMQNALDELILKEAINLPATKVYCKSGLAKGCVFAEQGIDIPY